MERCERLKRSSIQDKKAWNKVKCMLQGKRAGGGGAEGACMLRGGLKAL